MKAFSTLLPIWIAASPWLYGQQFTYHSDAPFGIMMTWTDSTKTASAISFYDVDADGDLDLLMTGLDYIDDFNSWQGVHFFFDLQLNTGDRYTPVFGPRQEFMPGFELPTGYFFVSPGDINQDGLMDLVAHASIDQIGNQKPLLYTGSGSPGNLSFTMSALDVFGIPDFVPESFYVPHLTDLDGDGDLDMIAGGFDPAFAEEDGDDVYLIRYAKNQGTDLIPDLLGWYLSPYELHPSAYGEILTTGDLDKDGDIDVIGAMIQIPPDSNNTLQVHLNSTTPPGRPAFETALSSPYGLPVGYGTAQLTFPTFADTDGDGDLDLYVFRGDAQDQKLEYYENLHCQRDTSILQVTICEGEAYDFNGTPISESGQYYVHLNNSLQCDSVVQLDLSLELMSVISIDAAICTGDTFFLGTDTLTQAGFYMLHIDGHGACDTIVHLILEEVANNQLLIPVDLCPGDSLVINDTVIYNPVTYWYTLPSMAPGECDTMVEVSITYSPNIDSFVNEHLCQGDSIVIYGEVFKEAGVYTRLIPGMVGCDTIVNILLEVSELDTNVHLSGQTLIASQADVQYQWLDCASGLDIPGANMQSFEPQQTGSYAVRLTDAFNCVAQSGCTDVVITSTANVLQDELLIYPVPASDQLFLRWRSGAAINGSITFFDINGHRVKAIPFVGETSIQIGDLNAGVYIIQAEGVFGTAVQRIVIQ